MGEFFGFGEDLRRDGYDVRWQVGFSGSGIGFNSSLPPRIQPSPLFLNLVLKGCRFINDERVIEVCRFLGENSAPCSGNKNLKQPSR